MRIDTSGIVNQIQSMKLRGVRGADSPDGAGPDSVRFSRQAQDFRVAMEALAAAPEVRQDRVEDLRQQIEAGTYSTPQTALAEKLLDRRVLMQEERLLVHLRELLGQQRAAIVRQDPAALARIFDKISDVFLALGETDSQAGNEMGAAEIARLARDEMAINRKLLSNGMSVTDHFVRSLAQCQPGTNVLFTGVA